MGIGHISAKIVNFEDFFPNFLTDMSKIFILDPPKPPLGKIFGLLEFLESKKHKIAGFDGNLKFLGIFQKMKIFENFTKIFPKSKIITPRISKVNLKCLEMNF